MTSSLDDALRDAATHGFVFVHAAGRPVLGVLGWAHYYDRLTITDDTHALAERAAIDPRPGPDEVVWCWRGDPTTAIAELLRLPKPHEPRAPRLLPAAVPVGLWRTTAEAAL